MRLLIADDHTLFRDALVQYIERAEPEAKVVLAKDFYQVEALMSKDLNYDLVLLDLKMPGMNRLEGFKKFRELYPETRVALMSGIAEPEDVRQSLELGASGYFPKTLSGRSLIRSIQLVIAGEKFVPIEDSSNLVMPSYFDDAAEFTRLDPFAVHNDAMSGNTDGPDLTPRENDVLQYLTLGMSNKEIAQKLGLQEVTIKLHVRGICRKLDAANRTQAALKAKDLGLVK